MSNPTSQFITPSPCPCVHISVLYICVSIPVTWKHPKCPSTVQWIKKMCYMYITEYYSAIKINEIGSFIEMWMYLESIKQGEVSQKENESVNHSVVSNSCDPMDCSPPGFSDYRILEARILEWVAIPFSRRSSQPRDKAWVSRITGRYFTIWVTWEAQVRKRRAKINALMHICGI